ncbi:MAG: UvrD-helicase domain-containing protein [Clostridiales bacterium]|nr:UvrD-helicase domain-containing protein [Clostridiales bacterium]
MALRGACRLDDLTQRYLAARRRIVEGPYARMNPAQREAVLAPDRPVLILAGAGSGKTTVLVNRIDYLLRFGNILQDPPAPGRLTELSVGLLEAYAEHPDPQAERTVMELIGVRPVKPWTVLAVTFTNKAARELRERLIAQLGPCGGEVVAGTFHAVCARILRRHIDRLGYPSDFTVYDTDDCKKLVKECLKSLNIDDKKFPAPQMLGVIGRAKDLLQGPDEFEALYRDDYRMSRIAKLYTEYQRRLKAAGALDFDDMIRLTVKLLQSCPDVLEFYQRRFAYVMVDEYQDTNHAQFVLTELLAGGGVLMVVGDDDQSIYRFRGATIENILGFEKRHGDAYVVRLEQNYRSTSTILDCANRTIANNFGRKGKRLWTENVEGEPARLYRADDSYDEARFVADTILALSAEEGSGYSDFAVLYRTNAQSAALEESLIKSGVPYRIFGGMKFYERKEVKDLIAYLSILVNPADDLRLRRILNEPKRGIGEATVQLLEQTAAEHGLTMLEAMARLEDFPALARQAERLQLFYTMVEDLAGAAALLPPSELLAQVAERTGYLDYLRAQDQADGRDRLSNLDTLADNIRNYERGIEEQGGDEVPTLTGFLENAALTTDLDQLDESAGYVSLMTMHAAKGLEFPVVFVTGMEEELFPSARSLFEPEELEEERRLFYVAITRARQRLYLTCARLRRTYNLTRNPEVSRFVAELPEDRLENLSVARAPVTEMPATEKRQSKAGYAAGATLSSVAVKGAPRTAPAPAFAAGDVVVHKKFGRGTVQSVRATGGDQLLEIHFEQQGLKKLMANFAVNMMQKEG